MDYACLSMISSTVSEQHSAAEVAQDGDTGQSKQIFRQQLALFNEQPHKKNSKSKEMKWYFTNNPLPEDYSPKVFVDGNEMMEWS